MIRAVLIFGPLFLILWVVLTTVVHAVRRRQLAWRIHFGIGNPKAPKAKHRYINRHGEWVGPGVAEMLKRLAEPDGMDWHNTVQTLENFYRTGHFSRAQTVRTLNRLDSGKEEIIPVPPRGLLSVKADLDPEQVRELRRRFASPSRANPSRREFR